MRALRSLLDRPIVTITTVLALAVGIGMATTGFTLLEAVLFAKLPFPNGERFVLLNVYTEPEAARSRLDLDRFNLIATESSAFDHLGAFQLREVNLLLVSGEIVPVRGTLITPGSIRLFSSAPILGRMLREEDGERGAPPVALLRESIWRRHFSAKPEVIGTVATLSGVKRTIVGVMPDGFTFPSSGELWLPLADDAPSRDSAITFGVLREGVDSTAATVQVAALTRQHEALFPAVQKLRIIVLPFIDAMSQGVALLATALVTCLVLVLFVIAANIANLVLARTVTIARDLAIRSALGASRTRLVAGIFAEILGLGMVAAVIGLTASQLVLAWIRQTLDDMPFWVDFRAGAWTMTFVAGVTLLAAAIAGIVPALKATARDVAETLSASSRGASRRVGGGVMVALQVAMSIALLNGSLVMARGVAGYMNPSIPVPATEVLTARVWTERTRAEKLVSVIREMPGVTAAGSASSLPGLSPPTEMIEIETIDGTAQPARSAPVVAADTGFFETFDARPGVGRLFAPGDFGSSAPPVVIVNKPLVAMFFGDRNPVGRRLRIVEPSGDAAPMWREIIGVVPDLGLSAGDAAMAAGVYVPLGADEVFHVAMRVSGDARRLTNQLRTAIIELDPEIQIAEIAPLQDVGREDRAVFAGIGAALAALGGIALLLSIVGTYALLSLAVAQRTREIGIRAALGATKAQIVRAIVGRTCLPPAIGATVGIGLGQLLVEARGIFAFRLPENSGPWGLPLLAVLMIVAGFVSAWVPTRRALRVDPADALRAE